MICDIAILIVFAIFLLVGYKRGFVRSVYSMLSVVISIVLLYFLRDFFAEYIVASPLGKGIYEFFMDNYGKDVAEKCSYAITYVISIILLYIIIRLLIKGLFNVLNFLAKLPLINVANSLLGAAFGAVSGALWILIIVNILYCIPKTADFVTDSSLVEYFNMLAVKLMHH